jgi:transposase
LQRDDTLSEHLDTVRALYVRCSGNMVRVREELGARGIEIGYSSLTAFCRQHEVGKPPKQRAGQYHFEPGQEMQHDTSPHEVVLRKRRCVVQCASLVLCYSRVLFAQVYVRWSRLECRAFLSEAIEYFGGAASDCMIDNSSVIIAHGRGRDAVPAAVMAALGERFGFGFKAHEPGAANRSARVERPFDHIERNFYAGRDFEDVDDLNVQLRAWCDRVNQSPKRSLPKTPLELLAAERPQLRPLPVYVPEVYDLHTRRVDVEGYVTLHGNRYSMPAATIGRQVEVRESMKTVRVFDGHRLLVRHARQQPGAHVRSMLPEHERDGRHRHRMGPSEPETLLRAVSPVLGELVTRLRKRHGGQALRAVRRLHKMYIDYPTDVLVDAVAEAIAFDLHDLGRIDHMVLRRIRGKYFRLPAEGDGDDEAKRELELPTEPDPADSDSSSDTEPKDDDDG